MKQKNILGNELHPCSIHPMTGYLRTGSCVTDEDDKGTHSVCAVVTNEFLEFTKFAGNDLTTPRPEYNFPGLKAGDKWCLCAERWKEAYDEGFAPLIDANATNYKTLQTIEFDILHDYFA